MDNTGKTTLCEQLSKELNIKVIKSPGPHIPQLEMEANIYAAMSHSMDLILERFSFFEEMVYGPILRGKSNFNFKSNIFKDIKEAQPIIVYCRPKKSQIKKWNNREQMDGVIDNSNKLIKKFDRVIRKCKSHGLKVIEYDYTKETVFDVIGKI